VPLQVYVFSLETNSVMRPCYEQTPINAMPYDTQLPSAIASTLPELIVRDTDFLLVPLQVYVFSLETNSVVRRFDAHEDDVNTCVFADHVSSNVILSGADDSLIKVLPIAAHDAHRTCNTEASWSW
jgi:hypothetical protein